MTIDRRTTWIRALAPLFVALGLGGCAGTGERQAPEGDEASQERAVPAGEIASEREAEWLRESRVAGFGSYTVHNFNYTLVVESPRDAMARARELVVKIGGEVTNASGNDDNANLNAILPPGEHTTLRGQLAKLAIRVESENAGRSEYAAPIAQAKRRLQRIETARMHLVEAMRGASGREDADALGLMMELTEQERRNLESQLTSYREQTRGSQLYVTFTRGVPGAIPIPEGLEMGKR